MQMQIATRTFESRVHLLNNGAKEANGELLDPGLSLRKKVERTAARTEKNGARGVLVCSRCAARRGAVL